MFPIFSYFSLIINEIQAENFLLKGNGGINSINTFTALKMEISFFTLNIVNIEKNKNSGYKKPFTKAVTFVWPQQSNQKILKIEHHYIIFQFCKITAKHKYSYSPWPNKGHSIIYQAMFLPNFME